MTSQLAVLLREHRDRIVGDFVAEVRRQAVAPPEVTRSLLVDHLPAFLDELAVAVDAGVPDDGTSDAAQEHGAQRWHLGYDLEAVLREYRLLRHAIFRIARERSIHLTLQEVDILSRRFDAGIADAAAAYVRHRNDETAGQTERLAFLAEAGQVLTSSLDYRSTIARLMELLVPRLADWCALHHAPDGIEHVTLQGGTAPIEIAHVDPAKVAIVREIYERFPLPPDSPWGYPQVARTGEAQLVSEVPPDLLVKAAKNEEHLALLRSLDATSWIMVPLQVQGKTFGAMTLACSGRHYGEADLMLASEVARRAAVAIDNAHLYEQSQRERARVEAALRAKDEFVAMVSHELRTPLNSILGWLRLRRTTPLGPAKEQHALGVIERNAEALSQLVSDLLDISRIISGRLRIHPSQVDLGNVIDMAIEGVRPAADAKRITIELDITPESTLRGDGDRLQQVIWNVLSNAVKFTSKNGVVRVRLVRVESDLELTVEDNGAGIDPSFLPFVFESFRQYDGSTTREHGGLGIGLSIARHIVELHGGSIVAKSNGKGHGATLVVRIPISPVLSATPGISRVPATTRVVDTVTMGLDGLRVLVVDDDPDARDLLVHVLETSGGDVRAAATANDALDALGVFLPHVVLSDVGMPNEDGYFFIRRIRSHPNEALRTLPVIALTGFARNEDRTRALVEGFNVHFTKPVEPADLVRTVRELAKR